MQYTCRFSMPIARLGGKRRSATRRGDEIFPHERFSDMTPEKGFAAQTRQRSGDSLVMEYVTALAPGLTSDALSSLFAALSVLIAIVATGALVAPSKRGEGTDVVVGLGAVCGGLAIWGSLGLPISIGWIVAGLLGASGIVVSARKGRCPGGTSWRVLVLLSPFLIVAAGTIATMWDDFWHWLPNAAYLYRYDRLPAPGLPETLSRWPSYPHTLPFIIDAVSLLTGRFRENAGHVTNIVLTAGFGATLVDACLGDRRPAGPLGRWAAAAAGALFATAFCPSFNRDVLYSGYSDVATAAALAGTAWIGCGLIGAIEEGHEEEAQRRAWRFALAATALVNLKQANLVLFVLLSGGLGLIAPLRGRVLATLRRAPVALAAPLLVFVVWRIHVAASPSDGEMSFRAVSTWNFAVLGRTLSEIWRMTLEYPAFFTSAYAATVLGLLSLAKPDTPAKRLAVTTAVVWLGYNAFLLLVYLGAMTPEEAGNAADYWRYAPHAGMLAVLTICVWIAETARWIRPPAWIGRLPAATLVAAVLIIVPLALDTNPAFKTWQQHFRRVGREAEAMLPEGARVVILGGYHLDPFGTALRFDLSGQEGKVDRNIRGVLHPGKLPEIAADVRSGALTHAVATDHFWPIPDVERDVGLPRLENETALFEWTGTDWKKLRSWPVAPLPRR